MTDVEVRNAPDRGRYEALVDETLVGYADYRLADGWIVFTHTEVDPAYEGEGVGSSLVRQSLEDVRARGELKVRLLCPFYKGYVEKHPDYEDLLVRAPAND